MNAARSFSEKLEEDYQRAERVIGRDLTDKEELTIFCWRVRRTLGLDPRIDRFSLQIQRGNKNEKNGPGKAHTKTGVPDNRSARQRGDQTADYVAGVPKLWEDPIQWA